VPNRSALDARSGPPKCLQIPLEQLQPVFELCDAEHEIVVLLATDETEPRQGVVERFAASVAQPARLVPPARQRIADRAPHLVAFDPDAPRQVVGQVIGGLGCQRSPADSGKEKLLD
jgi:hypothetical protein